MKIKSFMQYALALIFILWSCKDKNTYQGNHDPDVIKTYHNSSTSALKMDSLSSVNFITKQKLTELYELSSLFSANYNDSLMREILFPQIESYFLAGDSIQIFKLLKEMDSLKVHYVEVSDLNLAVKDSILPDSLQQLNYKLRYFSQDKRLIHTFDKKARFILKKEPKKFKHEFVFYFTDLFPEPEVKDSIPDGVTQ